MRAGSVINGLPPEQVGLDPLSGITSELINDLHKLQAMGLDLSDLQTAPKRSKSEQARINGAKSRGPVTDANKVASSQNALKHGLCAKGVLLPGEDPAAFELFSNDFHQELSPQGTLQKMLVVRAAELSWKLQRLPALEGAILESARGRQEREDEAEHEAGGIGDLLHQLIGREQDGILMRLQRYEIKLERSLQVCLRELRLVRKEMGSGAVGSFGNKDSCPPTAVRGTDSERAAGTFCVSGSFGTGAVGSFGTVRAQDKTGSREAAEGVEAPSPARGPSAARQDDGFAGTRLGLGSFRTGAVGSFGTGAGGSFRTDAVGSFCKNIVGSFGITGPFHDVDL